MKHLFRTALTMLTLVFYSCHESESTMIKNSRLLSNEQIKTIGKLHNQYLIEGLNSLDYNSLSVQQLDKAFYTISVSEVDNDLKKDAIEYYNHYLLKEQEPENEIEFVKQMLGNPIASEIIDTSVEMSLTFENINNFNTWIEAKKEEVMVKLEGTDLDAVLLFLEVMQQSAKFWFQESVTNKKISNIILQKSCTWKGAIAADGMGAAGGFLRFGVAGLLGGPATLGALIGVVGWSAAYSSASYLLLCNYQ